MRKARARRRNNTNQNNITTDSSPNHSNSDVPSAVSSSQQLIGTLSGGAGGQKQQQQQQQQANHYAEPQNNVYHSPMSNINNSNANRSFHNGDGGGGGMMVNTNSNDVIVQQQQQQQQQQTPKKPLSPAEAGLTAKNYRLAKELSDLRQKYREEIKNVTRLTIENMNLASRCRTAFQEIEKLNEELNAYKEKSAEVILKQRKNKELDAYKEKTAEVILKQHNHEKPNMRAPLELSITANSPLSNIGDIRKRIKKDKFGLQHLAPQDNDMLSPMNMNTTIGDSITNYSTDFEEENTKFTRDGISNNNNKYQNEKENKQQLIADPAVDDETSNYKHAHLKSIRKSNDITKGDISDIAFGELNSDDFFSGTRIGATSYENSLPATPEKEKVNVDITTEALRNQFEDFNIDEDERIKDSSSNEENNIDAFEASFQTSFPSSFAQTSSEQNLSFDEIFGDSNAFFTSSDTMDRNPSRRESESSDDEQALFPDTFGENIPATTTTSTPPMSTPSKDKSSSGNYETFEPPSPPSEKQTGNAAARARYKYALADPDENIAPMDETEADRAETSPILVLQRLQERKKIEKTNSNSIVSSDSSIDNSQSNNSKTPRSSISEEIRKLDAIANGNFTPPKTKTGSRRSRNVKQPISYAEPTLKSKLRRGDVFFPKGDVIDNEANTETTVKS